MCVLGTRAGLHGYQGRVERRLRARSLRSLHLHVWFQACPGWSELHPALKRKNMHELLETPHRHSLTPPFFTLTIVPRYYLPSPLPHQDILVGYYCLSWTFMDTTFQCIAVYPIVALAVYLFHELDCSLLPTHCCLPFATYTLTLTLQPLSLSSHTHIFVHAASVGHGAVEYDLDTIWLKYDLHMQRVWRQR